MDINYLNKIIFGISLSYLIYIYFTLSQYKYNITNDLIFTIIIIVIICFIIFLFTKFNYQNKFYEWNTDLEWSDRDIVITVLERKEEKITNISNFINMIVYYLNFNVFLIFVILILVLIRKNKKINDITNISDHDKKIYTDFINLNKTYIKIFLIVFGLFIIVGIGDYIKYSKLFIKIVNEAKTNSIYSILVIIFILIIMLSIPTSKLNINIPKIFTSNLSRTPKINVSSGEKPPNKLPENEYICYSNTCQNDDVSINKDFLNKYKLFINKNDCLNSGCETSGIKNSGLIANYKPIDIVTINKT